MDGLDTIGEDPPLGASNLNALQLVELSAGDHHIHHVMAALKEGIKALEQAAVLELPRVALGLDKALAAVLKVELLEVSQNADCQPQLLNSFCRLHLDQLGAWDELTSLEKERITLRECKMK